MTRIDCRHDGYPVPNDEMLRYILGRRELHCHINCNLVQWETLRLCRRTPEV